MRLRRWAGSLLVAACAGGGALAGCGSRPGGGGGARPASTAAAPVTSSAPAATATPAPANPAAPSIPARSKTARVIARSGDGFLEDQGGALIAHLKGTPYDRGVQYGELLGDRIVGSIAALQAQAQSQLPNIPSFLWNLKPLLTAAGAQVYQPHFRPDVLEMLRGIVDGAARRSPVVSLQVSDLVFLNSVIDAGGTVQALGAQIKGIFKCSGLAAWGPRTVGGKMFQERNVDLFTGTGLETQAVVIVEKPDGKLAFANATWAGMVGSASGMNEHGVAISQVWAFSYDVGFGEPWILTTRRILETAENVDGVWPAFSGTTRTYGSNFVFGDRGDGRGGKRRGLALESTYGMLAQADSCDPVENAQWNGIPLAIQLTNAVFRGDTPVNQAILDKSYTAAPGADPRAHGGYRDRYQQTADLVRGYEQQGTLVGTPEMEAISRKIAMASGSLQCVVYENDDLVLHVANSRVTSGGTAMARDEPFHDYDFDYYLPTASVAPDRALYSAGDTMSLAISVANRGRPRRLELQARLETGSTSVPLGKIGSAIDALTGATIPATGSFTVPALPAGPAELVLEVVEAGTQDVVDLATARVGIR